MNYCKLQIGCMLIILYMVFIYIKECRRLRHKHKWSVFDGLLGVGILELLFDGLTAYTVNHLESVDGTVNMVLHLFFLLSLDLFIFLLFLYMISITTGLPKSRNRRMLLYSMFLVNAALVVWNIPKLEYRKGQLSNYSMGISVYICFVMVAVYSMLGIFIFFRRWRYIEGHKRISIFTYLSVLVCVTGYQMCYPQSLISSIGVTIIMVGTFVNQENPSAVELSWYHHEMIMGFATLVENKDGSTGGHIRRTTMYVKLLAEELRRRGYYKEVLTKDYMKNLCLAAPMHDIGKIAVPDVILQKPGKLTEEEYEAMKLHAAKGGEIVLETFGHLGNEQYAQMAYEVARFHHEKWAGGGYPEGLKRKEIPLCARIMAIADVFDAVSEKRCYREALPLEQCFEIIMKGSGTDFDPVLVEVFLESKEKVVQVHEEASKNGKREGKSSVVKSQCN